MVESTTLDARLHELNITLPPPMDLSKFSFKGWSRDGTRIEVSGQLPRDAQGKMPVRQLGAGLSDTDAGAAAARDCAINLIAALREACTGKDVRIDDIKSIDLEVFVNAVPGFTEHSLVANGASGLLVEVFGTDCSPTRAAVGVSSLPFGVPVEAKATFTISKALAAKLDRLERSSTAKKGGR